MSLLDHVDVGQGGVRPTLATCTSKVNYFTTQGPLQASCMPLAEAQPSVLIVSTTAPNWAAWEDIMAEKAIHGIPRSVT